MKASMGNVASSSSSGPGFGLPDAMALLGAVCMTTGVGMLWSLAAALIAAGVLLFASAVILTRGEQ